MTFNNVEFERTATQAIREKIELIDNLGKDGVPEKEQQTIWIQVKEIVLQNVQLNCWQRNYNTMNFYQK